MAHASVPKGLPSSLLQDETRFSGGSSEATGSKRRVLVAEDSAVQRKIVETLLQRLEFEVDLACNGLQAVEASTFFAYAFILMDCQMPELDGLQATRHIRERERLTGVHVPIIAITAHGNREECLAAGMDDCLQKPCRIEALRELQTRIEQQAQQ